MMNSVYLALLLVLSFTTAHAENQAPEIVRLSGKVVDANGIYLITVESDATHYVLLCNPKAAGCLRPAPQGRYYLFTKNTVWQMPGAKMPMDLKFIQGWTGSYGNDVEGAGLVAVDPQNPVWADNKPGEALGSFVLESSTKRE